MTDTPLDQTDAPTLRALVAAQRRKSADFGAPGHASGRAAPPAVRKLLGMAAFAADVLTPKGLDDRAEGRQAVQIAHKLAAAAWGADVARYATAGSTQSLHVLLAAVARPGETVVVASNCHKAEWSTAVYAGLDLVPVAPEVDRGWNLEHAPSPASVAAALDARPEAKAVLVVSPSYFGVTADVRGIADACHARGKPLIVDCAWGAAFGFSDRLPPNPLTQGADAAVVSAHKTLAALGQGSVLLVKGGLMDPERVALAFELFETSSPSVAVLASLDASRRQMALEGASIWSRVVTLAERARKRLAAIEGVRVFGREHLAGPGAVALNPCVVTLDISALGVGGFEADDWLVREHQVVAGLSDLTHLLFNFTQGASARDAQRMVRGVRALSELARGPSSPFRGVPDAPSYADLSIDMVRTPSEAFAGEAELVPFAQAEGRIAAEIIAPAPPGVPRLVPGQRIGAEHVRLLSALREAGGFLLDPADDPDQRRVRVLKG